MRQPAKEILEVIQNEADFENIDVERAVIKALELLDKDLVYCQYETSNEIDSALDEMNKIVAKAESEIVDEDEDEDDVDDEEELLDLEDEDLDDEDEDLIIEDETEEEETTNDDTKISSTQ